MAKFILVLVGIISTSFLAGFLAGWIIYAVVYYEDFRAWKKVEKNLDKVKFYKRTSDAYDFKVYSKEGDLVIAYITLYEDKHFGLRDNYGNCYVTPKPYYFFSRRFANKLINILPSDYQVKFAKKSFKDYL